MAATLKQNGEKMLPDGSFGKLKVEKSLCIVFQIMCFRRCRLFLVDQQPRMTMHGISENCTDEESGTKPLLRPQRWL